MILFHVGFDLVIALFHNNKSGISFCITAISISLELPIARYALLLKPYCDCIHGTDAETVRPRFPVTIAFGFSLIAKSFDLVSEVLEQIRNRVRLIRLAHNYELAEPFTVNRGC